MKSLAIGLSILAFTYLLQWLGSQCLPLFFDLYYVFLEWLQKALNRPPVWEQCILDEEKLSFEIRLSRATPEDYSALATELSKVTLMLLPHYQALPAR